MAANTERTLYRELVAQLREASEIAINKQLFEEITQQPGARTVGDQQRERVAETLEVAVRKQPPYPAEQGHAEVDEPAFAEIISAAGAREGGVAFQPFSVDRRERHRLRIARLNSISTESKPAKLQEAGKGLFITEMDKESGVVEGISPQ